MWREKALIKLAHWHTFHPWRMLALVVIVTVMMIGAAGQLKMTMRTSDLLPAQDPMVVQFNRILEEFQTATSLIVVVQGEEEKIKDFADRLAPRILEVADGSQNDRWREEIRKLEEKITKLGTRPGRETRIEKLESEVAELRGRIDRPLFQRVDYKAPIDFLKEHMLMLVKEEDLKNLKDLFSDPNLPELLRNFNNFMEKEYVGDRESISTREKEDGVVGFLDAIKDLVLALQRSAQGEDLPEGFIKSIAQKILIGEPYFLSYDKTALILTAVPTFTIMDRDLLMVATEKTQELVDSFLQDDPGVKAGLTGEVAREHDEQVYSERSLSFTSLIALAAILILLMISFRMWVAPLLSILTLVVGLIWGMGTAFLTVGQLNMFTALMSIVLLGLGIDFSIHMISGLTERRAAGEDIHQAMKATFLNSGKGITTGALTTACAFLALMISQARGMKEMGLVTGLGLLAILAATMLLLPVLLVFRERSLDGKTARRGSAPLHVKRDVSFQFLGKTSTWMAKHYLFTMICFILLSAFLIGSAFRIRFDHNFMNMEPEGLTSIELMHTILDKFDLSMETAYALTDSLEDSKIKAEKFRELGSVAVVEDISSLLPSDVEQKRRIPYIEEVRNNVKKTEIKPRLLPSDREVLSREIGRLEMNIMEIQDMAFLGGRDKVEHKCMDLVGNPDDPDSENSVQVLHKLLETVDIANTQGLSEFQRIFAPFFKDSIVQMCRTEPFGIGDLPDAILDRFSNRSRDLFLVTIYPAGNLWKDGHIYRFVDDLESVTEKITGTAPLGLGLMRIFGRDGRNAVLLTLVIVFLLLWIDFGKIRLSIMAMIPLAFGVFWMIGIMFLLGQKLTIMNMMSLPLIIGIGIDYGVHITHRWKHEGKGKIRVIFSSTGKAILLTSLTTMLGFGSLVFSVFPGWVQFGGALSIGVGACFLTTVIVIPGMIGWVERK